MGGIVYNKKMDVRAGLRKSIYVLAAWLFAVLYIASNQFPDPDLWGRLSIGALFFQNGAFPYHDVFSYTAPHGLWVDHEWLTGLVFYQILDKTGEVGFLLFKYGAILAIFALLFRLHRQCYKASPLYALYSLVATVGVYSIGLYATTRSHLFSFFFFVLFLYWLEQVRLGQKSRRWLWLMLPVGVIWANLHGGFAMGLILLALYGVGTVLEQRSLKAGAFYWMLGAALFLSVGLINPYGLEYLRFLIHAWTLDRSRIGEWSAFRFQLWYFLPGQLLWMTSLVLTLLHWLRRDKNQPETTRRLITPTLVLFAMAAMMVKGVRFQPFLAWTAVAYAPVLFPPTFLSRLLPQAVKQWGLRQASTQALTAQNTLHSPLQNSFQNTLPILLLVSSVAGLILLQTGTNLFHVAFSDEMAQEQKPQIRYPLGIIQFLRESPYHGNLVVRFGLGEFAYWALYPRFKVSMDGRYEEVYTQAEFLRNHRFYNKKEPLLGQQEVEAVTASSADFILTEQTIPSTAVLLNSPAWELLNGNDHYLLFGKVKSLRKMPAFNPKHAFLPFRVFTIQDFVTPADRARFRQTP